LFLFSQQLVAQVNVRDSLVAGTLIHLNFGSHAPAKDLADRFGSFLSVGIDVEYKTRKNWLFGLGSNFYFGDRVNNRSEIFQELLNAQGAPIGLNGEYAVVDFLHRGVFVGGYVGKIFPIIGPNQNSGLVVKFGLGYLQNQIHFRNPNETFPQLLGNYAKGYDRLHSGWSMRQFVGYMNSGNRRTINYTLGFEFVQGFTTSARQFNYDTRQPDLARKLDLYFGIKASWFLPIYRDQAERFYYF